LVENLAAGNTAFAMDLYTRLKAADANLFFSPFSISTYLAMTYTGTRGETAAQMADVKRLKQGALPEAMGTGKSRTRDSLNFRRFLALF
jgi:serpin B